MPHSRTRRRTQLSVLAVVIATAMWASGCSDGDGTTTVSEQSDERPSTSAPTGDASEYCAAVEQLDAADGGLDLSEDADGALAGIERMAELAPPELADQFETFLDGVRSLAQLDEDDPAALTAILELMTDPEFEAAADAIEEYTGEQCGIDLGASTGADSSMDDLDDATGSGDMDEGLIELEDVADVKDDNASSTWAEKLNTTVINFGREVDVSSDAGALSADEALAACNALLSALVVVDPEVSVAVSAGDVELAYSQDGGCVSS
jgi:hypothetical protein